MAHFEHWLDSRDRPGTRGREQLTHAAAAPYRYIWKAWVEWLTSPQPHGGGGSWPLVECWTQAQPAHVMRYLVQGVSAAASKRRGETAPISDITRRRYWRVLQMIYAHAVNQHLIDTNPVMAQDDVQAPPQEDPEGLVLAGPQWQAVARAITQGESRWDRRDRAILRVLMDAGLTTGEIAGLRVDKVGSHLQNITLDIAGSRGSQTRTLQLGTGTSIDLRHWLEQRRGVKLHPATDPGMVFVTNQGRPMSGRTLFTLVSKTVIRGLRDGGFSLPQHIGPQVLRNSRIVMWLNQGTSVEEACRRAGIKDFRSLRGLRRHIREGVLPVSGTRQNRSSSDSAT